MPNVTLQHEIFSPALAWTLFLLALLVAGLVTMAIRLAKSSQTNSLHEFYLASCRLSWPWVAISFAASWFGAASTLATLDAITTRGLNGLWDIALPSLVSVLLIAFWLGPRVARWCQQHQAISMPEAVLVAYGPVGRWGFAVIIVTATTTMLAAQLLAAGGVFQALLAIPLVWTVVGFATVITLYATLGGYRAVVMTDGLQLILIGLGLLIPLGWLLSGHTNTSSTVLPAIETSYTPTWVQLGTLATFVAGWAIAPEMWQRMQSLAEPKQASRAVWVAAGLLSVMFCLVVATGLLAQHGLATSGTSQATTGATWGTLALAMPHPLLAGLMFVGITAAIASTMDSCLNVGSLAMAHDVVEPLFGYGSGGRSLPQQWHRRLAQAATLAMMAMAVTIALVFSNLMHILWMSADLYATVMFIPVVALLSQASPSRWGGLAAMATGSSITLLLRVLPLAGVELPAVLGWPWATWWGVGLAALAYGLGQLLESLTTAQQPAKL